MDISRRTPRSSLRNNPSIFHSFALLSLILSTPAFALPTNDVLTPLTPLTHLPQRTTFQRTLISPRQAVPSSGNSEGTIGSSSDPGFNYYFIILAAVAAAALAFLFIKSRRRKQRLFLQRASDAPGFQSGTPGRGWPTNPVAYAHRQYYNQSRRPAARVNRTEGLDERGEAPPPYVPGTKPPSIDSDPELERVGSSRSVVRRSSSVVNDVELGDMTRPSYAPPSAAPPGYHDNANANSNGNGNASSGTGISRPEPAVTAGGGLGSVR